MRNLKRFTGVYLLTRSSIVRVGVAAANVPLGGLIKLSSEPLAFQAQANAALSARGRV